MLALADKKVETMQRRGFEHAAVYNPGGVGGTHMMYVVPHGDRLEDYSLPAHPVASPKPLAGLNVLQRVGSYLLGFGVLGALGHLLAFGPESADRADGPDA
jgi:formate dehydrogenase iron-sulfur subunit